MSPTLRILVALLCLSAVGCDYNRDREKLRQFLIDWNFVSDSPLTVEPKSALVRLDEGISVHSYRKLLSGGLADVTQETEWYAEDLQGHREKFEESGFFQPKVAGFYWVVATRGKQTARIPIEAVSEKVRRLECVELRPAGQKSGPLLEFKGSFASDPPSLFSLTRQKTQVEVHNQADCPVGVAVKTVTASGQILGKHELTLARQSKSFDTSHELLSRMLVTIRTCAKNGEVEYSLGDAKHPIAVRNCDARP